MPFDSLLRRQLNSRRTLCFGLGTTHTRLTDRQWLVRELLTKRRPTDISVHPLAALMPSAAKL